jgi:hypothetical protein
MIGSSNLLIVGLSLLVPGVILMYWASSRDLKDAAIGAALGTAWTLLWKRQRPGVPDAITTRVDEVRAQDTHLGKARVVGGFAVKHVLAQVANLVGLILMALGVLLAALGIFWK